MNLLHSVQARYFVPALIMLGALVIAAGLYLSPSFSQAADTTDMGCGGDAYAGINCSAGEEVRTNCEPLYMAYQENTESSFQCPGPGGYYWSGNRGGCRYEPVLCGACVADSSCAANTCSTTTCSDSCGNSYTGTQNCTPPPPTCQELGYDTGTYPSCRNYTCQDYGYNYGTVGCCYNNADRSDDACYYAQGYYAPTTCTSAENYCGATNTGTLSGGVCSATTPANPDDYCPAMAGYQCPGSTCDAACVADASCAATTPVGQNCTDSCGNPYAGTYVAPTYSEASYAPVYSESTYYAQSTYAPVGCGAPSATLTAAPTRVRSGQTSTLTLSATGVTTSCTITGPGVNSTVAASSCGVSSTIVTPAITSQVTYKVTCDSTVDIAKIIVNLVPKVTEF